MRIQAPFIPILAPLLLAVMMSVGASAAAQQSEWSRSKPG